MGKRRAGSPPVSVATDESLSRLFLYKEVGSLEFDQILTLIGNYAFPICCCVYLFWSSAKEREAHKTETDKLTEALNNNTIALTELCGLVKNGDR